MIAFDPSAGRATTSYLELLETLEEDAEQVRSREEYLAIPQGNLIRSKTAGESSSDDQQAGNLEDLQLTGILAGSPRFSRALIRETGSESSEPYALSDRISGYTIVAMFSDFIELEDSGGAVNKLRIYDPAYQKLVNPSSPAGEGKIEKIVLSRDRFLQYLKDQAELFRVKFAPELNDGKITGWNLLEVPEDHFLHSLGARGGDTIRRFNGQDLESQERLIEMWQSLKTLSNLTIDLERNGATITYNVVIQ